MPADSASFLSFWSALFLRPRTFFREYLVGAADRPPYFALAILLYGVGYGIERVDKQLTKADVGGRLDDMDWLNHWPSYWAMVLVGGVLGGYLAYLIAGWFYHVRLRWSGASRDMPRARTLYLYSSVVASTAYVTNAVVATALLAQPYSTSNELSTAEGTGGLLMILFTFYSVYVSYCGVTTTTDAEPGKARLWFLVLPMLLYGAALVTLAGLFAWQSI